MDPDLSRIIDNLPLSRLERIDCAFEGDWSGSVHTLWSPEAPEVQLPDATWATDRYKPSIELIFDTTWFGIRCYTEDDGIYRLDAPRATAIIEYVLRARA